MLISHWFVKSIVDAHCFDSFKSEFHFSDPTISQISNIDRHDVSTPALSTTFIFVDFQIVEMYNNNTFKTIWDFLYGLKYFCNK